MVSMALDLVACGCSFKASMKTYIKLSTLASSRGFGGNKEVVFDARDRTKCGVVSIKATETLLNGVPERLPRVLEIKEEPPRPISLTNTFEVVADDLLTLNQNLLSIIGAENPVLMSAAEQIFCAGGKRIRPALVFLVSRATTELVGLGELTREHRRLSEIIEMIHTASLIHDDVLEESDMRRGKETVNQMFGTRATVLAGDFMFSQSSWYLANLDNLTVIMLISQVPKGHVWIQGNNTSHSFDSRYFGPVPYDRIQGRVVFRVWPPAGFGLVGGDRV